MLISRIYRSLQRLPSEMHAENPEEFWRGWLYLFFCPFSYSPRMTPVPNIPIWWGDHHFPTTMWTLFLLLQDMWWLLIPQNFYNVFMLWHSTQILHWSMGLSCSSATVIYHQLLWLFVCRSILPFQRWGSLFKILYQKGSGRRVKRKQLYHMKILSWSTGNFVHHCHLVLLAQWFSFGSITPLYCTIP